MEDWLSSLAARGLLRAFRPHPAKGVQRPSDDQRTLGRQMCAFGGGAGKTGQLSDSNPVAGAYEH
jgi:hypothetical protein